MTDSHKTEGVGLGALSETPTASPLTTTTVLDLPLRWLRLTPAGGLAIVPTGGRS